MKLRSKVIWLQYRSSSCYWNGVLLSLLPAVHTSLIRVSLTLIRLYLLVVALSIEVRTFPLILIITSQSGVNGIPANLVRGRHGRPPVSVIVPGEFVRYSPQGGYTFAVYPPGVTLATLGGRVRVRHTP